MTPLPDLLPGEDRNFGSGLFIDLIPRGTWFTNVRSSVSSSDWDRIRKMVYARADHTCEACGRTPIRKPGDYIEAHERWQYRVYEDGRHVQKLMRLVALCTRCHSATHFGRAEVTGYRAQALAQLMKINGWNTAQAEEHVQQAFEVWAEMCRFTWELDISILTAVGIKAHKPQT